MASLVRREHYHGVSWSARRTHLGIEQPAGMMLVARGPQGFLFLAARVPSSHAVVFHAGSEADEASFTAVLDGGTAPRPPRTLAVVASAPRTAEGLGLGSTRAAVERIFGAGRAATRCGYEIVRYEPSHPEMTASEMWFFYRAGRVAAFISYAAV